MTEMTEMMVAYTRDLIPGFQWKSGKVRDRTKVDSSIGLEVFNTTNRISAFDEVLPTLIPGKGVILTQLSNMWKRLSESIIPNDVMGWDHYACLPYLNIAVNSELARVFAGRMILCRKAEVIPVECVVRGYIDGSFWTAYDKARGGKPSSGPIDVLGYVLQGDLIRAQKLPQPIFTPSTKATEGHDVNLDYDQMVEHLDQWLSVNPGIKRTVNADLLGQAIKSTSLVIYSVATEYAWQRRIIIADTKLEFGFIDGRLSLIDEVLTPDSSRFWDAEKYASGKSQPSFDKQPLRDWLTDSGWNKEPPAPELPPEVVKATTERYQEAYRRLISKEF